MLDDRPELEFLMWAPRVPILLHPLGQTQIPEARRCHPEYGIGSSSPKSGARMCDLCTVVTVFLLCTFSKPRVFQDLKIPKKGSLSFWVMDFLVLSDEAYGPFPGQCFQVLKRIYIGLHRKTIILQYHYQIYQNPNLLMC